jgi:hypothetical protein
MPKTAYLKLIDIWLIFCLVVPFVTFIVQIFWELGREKREKNKGWIQGSNNQKGWTQGSNNQKGWSQGSNNQAVRINSDDSQNPRNVKIIQYTVVSLTLILIACYWFYAFAVYFNFRPW